MRVSDAGHKVGRALTSAGLEGRSGETAVAESPVERLLRLQRMVGNQAVQALLARERRLQREAGWAGKDIGPRSPNRSPMLVKGTEVKRVPVQGVKGGHEDSDLGTKMHDPETGKAGAGPEVRTRTHELPGGGGGGRAIVLIPQWLPELETVEVLFFLHGHMVGYREHGGEVDDRDLYRFEQQLQAVKPRPMIAILPQGGFYSAFGTTRKDVDVDAYIANVLPLVPESEWPNGAPKGPGGVVVSGHSGAGAPIASMLEGGEMPAGDQFEGLILFDSINTGPTKKKGDEYTPVRDSVLAHVDHDLKQLAPLKTDGERTKWLVAHGFRFRAYYSTGGYRPRFLALKDEIDQGIDERAAGLDPPLVGAVLSALHDNYQVLPAGEGVGHLETMGGHQDPRTKQFEHENVKDALSHLGEAQATPHTGSAPAPARGVAR